MPRFDFDTPIDRTNTDSEKWDKYAGRDVIPMWVADMDFAAPTSVQHALHEHINHGVLGYGHAPQALIDAVIQRIHSDTQWQIEAEWLVWLPGLVSGLNIVGRAIGATGSEILSVTPVYQHLFQAPANVGKQSVTVPLMRQDGRWTFDFAALENKVSKNASLFMLCNPHNPVGRMWDKEELLKLAEFCQRHNLMICSDEIHCQLLLDTNKQHIPIAALDGSIAANTITLMAPSKTYNIPGLGCSYAIIPNPKLRQQFQTAMQGIVPHVNILGYSAALAAYRDGEEWLNQLLAYLRGNYQLIQQSIANIPSLSLTPLEATYLAWIEVNDDRIKNPTTFFEQAGVGLSPGEQFQGKGFVRLNFGCPRSLLQEGLTRMEKALRE